MTLFGGLEKPLSRFGVILRHALAMVVHNAEVALGNGIALFGSLEKPLSRLGVILRHALAFVVHAAEIDLRNGMTLFGGLKKPLWRLGVVLRTPSPSWYMTPRLDFGRWRSPCSAALRNHRAASA